MAKSPVRSLNTVEYDELIALLREVREQAGVGQADLCTRLGQSDTYVYKIETKERRLDVVELVFIVEALGLSAESFLSRFAERIRPSKPLGD